MTEDDFIELACRAKKISEAIQTNSYFDVSQRDVDFHRYIWEKAGSPVLFRMLDQ